MCRSNISTKYFCWPESYRWDRYNSQSERTNIRTATRPSFWPWQTQGPSPQCSIEKLGMLRTRPLCSLVSSIAKYLEVRSDWDLKTAALLRFLYIRVASSLHLNFVSSVEQGCLTGGETRPGARPPITALQSLARPACGSGSLTRPQTSVSITLLSLLLSLLSSLYFLIWITLLLAVKFWGVEAQPAAAGLESEESRVVTADPAPRTLSFSQEATWRPLLSLLSPFSVWVAQLRTGSQNRPGAFWAAWVSLSPSQPGPGDMWVARGERLTDPASLSALETLRQQISWLYSTQLAQTI